MLELDRQEELQKLIFQNALVIIEGGTMNPIGLLTGAMAIYGMGTAGKNTIARIKKPKAPPTG